MSLFTKATREGMRLRMAISGLYGSGKTYTSLLIADLIKGDGRVAVLDTDTKAARLFSDVFDFDDAPLTEFAVENYIRFIEGAQQEGYSVLVLDSISDAWEGAGGVLDFVQEEARKRDDKNSFAAWNKGGKVQEELVSAILSADINTISTMRMKIARVQERDNRGRTQIRTLGEKPTQREGIEYRFDVYATMDREHRFRVEKSRCPDMEGKEEIKPQAPFFAPLVKWVTGESLPEVTLDTPEEERTFLDNVKLSLMDMDTLEQVDEYSRNLGKEAASLPVTEQERIRAEFSKRRKEIRGETGVRL